MARASQEEKFQAIKHEKNTAFEKRLEYFTARLRAPHHFEVEYKDPKNGKHVLLTHDLEKDEVEAFHLQPGGKPIKIKATEAHKDSLKTAAVWALPQAKTEKFTPAQYDLWNHVFAKAIKHYDLEKVP